MEVIKRDGRKVAFNKEKIINAICMAFKSVNNSDITSEQLTKAEDIANYVENLNKDMTVEEIQDIVEKKLMSSSYKNVAKEYILYRNNRTIERERKSKLSKDITRRLKANDVENQNANVDEKSFGGRLGSITSDVMKHYALYNCMSKKSRINHLSNRIYIHDLDHYAIGDHNCLTVPFDDLLAKGFNTRQTDIRPANSINTAFQLVAVIFQAQSLQQFGGVSASHLDWTLVPYVRKSFYKHYKNGLKYIECLFDEDVEKELASITKIEDVCIDNKNIYCYPKAYQYAMDMTQKEAKQAAEGMYHNLNSLQSRSGNQLPFSSINYGTCTLPEGRMIIKALLNGCLNGVGKFHKTSIFPCGIFQYMKCVNDKPGTPNYDMYQLALKSTAQRLYPNYANVDWSGNKGYDRNDPKTYFSTMGCRTANGWDINGFGQLKDGRGNICPVTIILPTLAMDAKEELDNEIRGSYVPQSVEWYQKQHTEKFLKILDKAIDDAKDMLIERFEYICSQSPEAATFMYENGLMAGYIPEEGIRSALKHGTLAVGQLGLAECLQILINCDHTTNEGMELAKRIENLFKTKCAEFKEKYKLNFGVYYTPAENLCFTAMKKFKEKYGEIPNVSDKKFFTNSMHVPVWVNVTPIEKINIESQLTGYSSAGCITYVELDGTVKHNLQALETIVNYAMDKDIPYFAINVPNDTCLDCGYCDEMNDTCPECGGNHIQRLRRVTGLSKSLRNAPQLS